MSDLEYEDIHQLVTQPAASIPGQVTRRLFLQGALATGGALALLPSAFDSLAAAATPVGADEGILVVIHMGGGNDGLNFVPPRDDGTYRDLRGSIAIAEPLALSSAFGFHPALGRLRTRYEAGQVAIVQGVGQTGDDRSHFSSTATWMAGTASGSRSTGWLGRWLDGVPEATEGLRAVSIGAGVPLHLRGQQAVVTALDTGGGLFGADRSDPVYAAAYDAVASFATGSTGTGVWGDELATAGALAIDLAADLDELFVPLLPDDSLTSQLVLCARLINANLGIRVLNVSYGSFDTHDNQLTEQQALLAELDEGIDAFYAALDRDTWGRRVALMSFSEFGRRGRANASLGTDHGNGSSLVVVGDNVLGGFHGQAPDLRDLDDGDPRTHVDFRSYYASVLGGWLGGDVGEVMGEAYEDLGLFRGTPGQVVAGPITTGRWVPFASALALVEQQYRDFLGREPDSSGAAFWANRLESRTNTISEVILRFLDSSEFGRVMAPVVRLALAALRTYPTFADLTAWTSASRGGTPLADIAADVVTRPAFVDHYGAMATGAYVDAAYRDVAGRPPSSSARATWIDRIDGATHSRADLLVALVGTADAERRFEDKVNVAMTYAGLLQRSPDPSGWDFWVRRTEAGTSVGGLVAQFFTSSEYRRRFGGT